jgi:hypothetical protein
VRGGGADTDRLPSENSGINEVDKLNWGWFFDVLQCRADTAGLEYWGQLVFLRVPKISLADANFEYGSTSKNRPS